MCCAASAGNPFELVEKMPKIFGRMSAPPLSALLLFLCLPSAAADEAVIIERLYTGGSCSGGPAEEVTFPSGRCVEVSSSYWNAWDGPNSMPGMYFTSVFVVGTQLQYCWALTQAACDAATRSVINSGDDQVNGGATMPALVYPDTTTAVCGEYIDTSYAAGACLTAAAFGLSTMADAGCTLSGCRLSLTVATAPSPPPVIFMTDGLYTGAACSGQPAASHTNVIGECELMSTAYRNGWGDDGSPSASGAPFMYVGNSRDAYCWGTTKAACESGLFAYPYGTDEELVTSTLFCGNHAGAVGTCNLDTYSDCTIPSCHWKLTLSYPSPSPPAGPAPGPAAEGGGGFPVVVVIIAAAAAFWSSSAVWQLTAT